MWLGTGEPCTDWPVRFIRRKSPSYSPSARRAWHRAGAGFHSQNRGSPARIGFAPVASPRGLIGRRGFFGGQDGRARRCQRREALAKIRFSHGDFPVVILKLWLACARHARLRAHCARSQESMFNMVKKLVRPKAEPRDTALSLRVKRSVRDAIAEAAISDGRSSSALVEMVMSEWLKEKGFLK